MVLMVLVVVMVLMVLVVVMDNVAITVRTFCEHRFCATNSILLNFQNSLHTSNTCSNTRGTRH